MMAGTEYCISSRLIDSVPSVIGDFEVSVGISFQVDSAKLTLFVGLMTMRNINFAKKTTAMTTVPNQYGFGALFDLDGVIIDSETLYTGFWNDIEAEFPTGIPDYAIAIKGRTLESIMEEYPTEEIRREITRRLMEFQASMRFTPLPGAVEMLEALAAAGIPSALVTSSDAVKMQRLFDMMPRLRGLFLTVIDGSMVTHSKPHPEGYCRAAREIGMEPERCVVFEDSLQGLAAGRASGATVVGLATTYPVSRVEPLSDVVISSWQELPLERLVELMS